MIVVSDTSPLHYLILIGSEHLLPKLFGEVIAPSAVMSELVHPQAPEVVVREWALKTPNWLQILDPQSHTVTKKLGAGESAAIALACELHADVVLIDERDGAKFAREQGLFVTGGLGVLQLAAKRDLMSLAEALTALGTTSFRHTKSQFEQLLQDHDES